MFYGEYKQKIDLKGRIQLPRAFIEALERSSLKGVMLTRGLDQCIFALTQEEWEAQESYFSNLPLTQADVRQFNRMFFSGAISVTPDVQGKIALPPSLRDYAGIAHEAVIVGVSNRIELWNVQRWQSVVAQGEVAFEQAAQRISAL